MSEKKCAQPFKIVESSCSPANVLLFPCSGGSNVGQIANTVGVKLTTGGVGKFFCLAGVGAHDDGMLASAGVARRVVAIDGCPVACSKRTLEHAGVAVTDAFVLTDMGVTKNKDYDLNDQDIEAVYRQIAGRLESTAASS